MASVVRGHAHLSGLVGVLLLVQLLALGVDPHSSEAASSDLRQAGNIEISSASDIRPGGRVVLTIPVKNYGGSTSYSAQAYLEGTTGTGNLFRPSGASAAAIGPGQTVTFTVSHDLWGDNPGTWRVTAALLWNASSNGYVGPLSANGYSQQVSFAISATGPSPAPPPPPATATPVDLRQAGNIEIDARSDVRLGGKVYLNIPVQNVGGTASGSIQAYGEGMTGTGNVWRPSDATATSIAPGQTVVFTVSHDIWADNPGTWRLTGAFLWNAGSNSYVGPLNANGYRSDAAFYISSGTEECDRSPGLVPSACAAPRSPGTLVIKDATIQIISQTETQTRIRIRVTVENVGDEPAKTAGWGPGKEFGEGGIVGSRTGEQGKTEEERKKDRAEYGAWRIGVEHDDDKPVERGEELDHRWRWGFAAAIPAHKTAVTGGDIVLQRSAIDMYYIGLVKEGVEWVVWRFAPSATLVSVGIEFPWLTGTHYWTGGPHGHTQAGPCRGCLSSVVPFSSRSGMDFGGGGWSVHPIAAGKVTYSGKLDSSLGYGVVVDHGSFQSVYAHMSEAGLAGKGTVGRASLLGTSGCTGTGCDAPHRGDHLHVDLRRGGIQSDGSWQLGDPLSWNAVQIGGWIIHAADPNYAGWAEYAAWADRQHRPSDERNRTANYEFTAPFTVP